MIKLNNSFSEEEEKAVLKKINSANFSDAKIALSDREIEVCKKLRINPSRYSYLEQGRIGHRIANKTPIGAHIVGKGYYKIVGIKNNYQLPNGVFDEVLVTYYSKHFRTDFLEEEVLINARPFYNNASIGPKSQLKVGMILHIKEDTTVVNKTYRIVWEIL